MAAIRKGCRLSTRSDCYISGHWILFWKQALTFYLSVLPATKEQTPWIDANFINRGLLFLNKLVQQSLLTRIMNMATWILRGPKFLFNKYFLSPSFSFILSFCGYNCLHNYLSVFLPIFISINFLSNLSNCHPHNHLSIVFIQSTYLMHLFYKTYIN